MCVNIDLGRPLFQSGGFLAHNFGTAISYIKHVLWLRVGSHVSKELSQSVAASYVPSGDKVSFWLHLIIIRTLTWSVFCSTVIFAMESWYSECML